ncbi:cation:proton antiporter [Dactylosporangium siamense]|uniref:Peptidase n=1 Tax=Dactylosporangium siamense TaxID=685454 RepID=A0A919PV70_9ACTN|nr:sodium:proton antiporter [Dactylosporangium siamense]GIG50839.1 peptidase [Dactylosporangium siamense]
MNLQHGVLAIAAVLAIVSVAKVAPRVGVAVPIALVVVGIGASYLPFVPNLDVDPHLILTVVLPPILYSAAVNVHATDFRRNVKAIGGLSVLLVVISALAVGFLLHWLIPDLSLAAAIALGAVVSPPDAVAAISIGKRLGLPPRLVIVLEGEGLINDATALVMLRSAVAATAGVVSLWDVVGDFAFAVVAGLVIGLLAGFVTVWIRAKLDEPVLTTAISFIVPFLAFVPAEEIHASGVLAVVVAGLVTGHQSARHFTAQDRISERTNWRTVQLLLDNGVFLLMGYQIVIVVRDVREGEDDVARTVLIGLAVTAALVLLRVLFVLPLTALLRRDQRRALARTDRLQGILVRLTERQHESAKSAARAGWLASLVRRRQADDAYLTTEGLGWRGGAALAWAGMRGVVTLAAAQSLPESVPHRAQLILIAFTVAIVTLLGQGATLPVLIRRLRIAGTDAEADRRELTRLIGEITAEGEDVLDNPDLRQSNGLPFDPDVLEAARRENAAIGQALTQPHDPTESSAAHQRRELHRLLLESAQAVLLDARESGTYTSRALGHVQHMLDTEVSGLDPAETH